jgi:FkbM family methyltransferase
MYKIIKNKIKCYTGKEVIASYREGTSDFDTLRSICQADEYKTKELGDFEGQVVIDIGSHIGALPLLLSTISKNLGVYCYEPLPENYQILFNNLQDNDLQGFGYCWQNAVACRFRPKARIYYGDDSPDGLVHKFIGSPIWTEKKNIQQPYIDVETVTLTDIFVLNDIVKVHLLKIDAETFEWEILADTPPEILKTIKWIVGDLHPHPNEPEWQNLNDLLRVLHGLFEPMPFGEKDPNSHNFFLKNKNL